MMHQSSKQRGKQDQMKDAEFVSKPWETVTAKDSDLDPLGKERGDNNNYQQHCSGFLGLCSHLGSSVSCVCGWDVRQVLHPQVLPRLCYF